MTFHRIKKYSRQIVCQDCILSCQPNHIEEIPLLKRAQISGLSLQNTKMTTGGERGTLLERDLDLSGMLMSWHLWNSRSVPFFARKKKAESRRRTGIDKRESMCDSLLTLRDQTLYMAIEKYLLFLMPREMKKERIYNHPLHQLSSRRERVQLSALYVHTALGLCQYKVKHISGQNTLLNTGRKERSELISSTLSPNKILFPCVRKVVHSTESVLCNYSLKGVQNIQDFSVSQGDHYNNSRDLAHNPLCKTLSLYCPSVLSSPDIQDIAQSGLVTLEGKLTLEFV